MKIVIVRRASQVVFLLIFLWFVLVTTSGDRWHQIRDWPVNWMLELDPLAALGTLLTTGALYSGLLWALATVVLTIVLGRFFCGWLCPFGTMHHFMGWVGRISGVSAQGRRYYKAQSIKYYVLLFLLTAASIDLWTAAARVSQEGGLIWVVPAVALIGFAVTAMVRRHDKPWKMLGIVCLFLFMWMAAGRVLPGDEAITASLLTGFVDPMSLVYRSISLVFLPFLDRSAGVVFATPRFYDGAWFIGTIFVVALLSNLVIPRLFCRFVCPLGALLALLSRFSIWRMVKTDRCCSDCMRCDAGCEGGCEPSGQIRTAECVLCMNCMSDCEDGAMTYGTSPLERGERPLPDISRRGVLASITSGLVAVPLLRSGGWTFRDRHHGLVRPPGALAESDFLDRCLRCGQCMRICPTNVLQPAGVEAGLEGLWTPVLNNRIGTSGCQLECNACGSVCPTGAIRPFTMDEKLGRGEFAQRGPIRIGAAFMDRGRCLPWSMDRPCIVCQENCPVSPKAIFIRYSSVTIRGGDKKIRLGMPYVDLTLCTGCGICENVCPVRGLAGIRVTTENESRDRDKPLIGALIANR